MADEKYTSAYTGAKIDEAVGHDHYANDYVVEYSLTGDWAYRKWASGIAECWHYQERTDVEITQKWSGTDMYYKNLGKPPNYPFRFVDYPIVSATIQSTLGYALGIYNYSDYSRENPGTAYLLCPTQPNIDGRGHMIDITFNYYVIGKWE